MEEGQKKKRGRPPVAGSKHKRLDIRISIDDKMKIEQACQILGVSLTDFLVSNCVKKAESCIKKQAEKIENLTKSGNDVEYYYGDAYDYENE